MNERTHKIEIYKAYITTIIATENRSNRTSTVYMSVLIAIATFASSTEEPPVLLITMIIFLVSLVWYFTSKYFRRLTETKYLVIKELERGFGFPLFRIEEENFQRRYKHRQTISDLETFIPLAILSGSSLFLVLQRVLDIP